MYFFIDEKRKVIFGWSPKCGSNHIIKLFTFLTGHEIPVTSIITGRIPPNHQDYKIILVMRNPFERLVSGFMFLYRDDGYCRTMWKTEKKLTFRNFVNELIENSPNIDNYHFDPQLSQAWPLDIQLKIDKVYDISQIDYSYIESLYGDVKIPESIRNFKGGMVNKHTIFSTKLKLHSFPMIIGQETKVYDMEIKEFGNQVQITQFYDQDILNKVTQYYKQDLDFILSTMN